MSIYLLVALPRSAERMFASVLGMTILADLTDLMLPNAAAGSPGLEEKTATVAGNMAIAKGWKDLGDGHLTAGDLRGAATHYEGALRIQPDYIEARYNLGVALQELGEWEKAAASFREVLRLNPSSGEAFNNLGNAFTSQGKLVEATAAYEQALRLLPGNSQVVYNLGISHYEQGDREQAAFYYRQALRLNPGHANASNNLATVFQELGLFDEAISQNRQTLKIRPDHGLAYYNLSCLAAGKRFHFSPEELGRLKACLHSSDCSPFDKSLYCFTLATVLHQKGSYQEAFGFYQQANDLRKSFLQERGISFDAQKHQALIEGAITTFDRAYFDGVVGWGLDSESPVFIIGMPRSGSTLVEQILASHPHVFGAGELGDVPRFVNKSAKKAEMYGQFYTAPVPDNQQASQEMASGYLQHIANLGQGAARVTSKSLGNYFHLGIIATLFPRARIIHCRRDPLDLGLSCYFQNFQDLAFSWSLEDIGACYRSYEQLMAHWQRVLPLPIHEVCYEDLVHHQEPVTRDLLAFCGLEWNERCLTFYKTPRAVRTASNVQVRNPLSTQAIGRWKKYRAHLGPLFKALGLPADRATESTVPDTTRYGSTDLSGPIWSPRE